MSDTPKPFSCACRVMDRFQCVEIRYGKSNMPDLDFGECDMNEREECECPCHDDYRDDWEDYL